MTLSTEWHQRRFEFYRNSKVNGSAKTAANNEGGDNGDVTSVTERKLTRVKRNEDLSTMTREELIAEVERHKQRLAQLQATVKKSDKKVYKQKRQFDFALYNTRHIALKFAYLGWDYSGANPLLPL